MRRPYLPTYLLTYLCIPFANFSDGYGLLDPILESIHFQLCLVVVFE